MMTFSRQLTRRDEESTSWKEENRKRIFLGRRSLQQGEAVRNHELKSLVFRRRDTFDSPWDDRSLWILFANSKTRLLVILISSQIKVSASLARSHTKLFATDLSTTMLAERSACAKLGFSGALKVANEEHELSVSVQCKLGGWDSLKATKIVCSTSILKSSLLKIP